MMKEEATGYALSMPRGIIRNMRYCTFEVWDEQAWSAAEPLFEEAFPPQGRKTTRHIRKIMDTRAGALHLALQGEEAVAMAVTGDLPEIDALLIDYIAVRGISRSRGIGREMMRRLEDDARARGLRGIVVEIEAEPSAENERRRAFWSSLGFASTEYVHKYRWVPETYRALCKELRPDAGLPRDGETLFRAITGFHRKIWGG